MALSLVVFFFFQAEDGIRDIGVTGVQTCALPISAPRSRRELTDVEGRLGSSAELFLLRDATKIGGVLDSPNAVVDVFAGERSEERRVGKSVDLGGRRIIKKKKKNRQEEECVYDRK